jgi:hypothetical protein
MAFMGAARAHGKDAVRLAIVCRSTEDGNPGAAYWQAARSAKPHWRRRFRLVGLNGRV